MCTKHVLEVHIVIKEQAPSLEREQPRLSRGNAVHSEKRKNTPASQKTNLVSSGARFVFVFTLFCVCFFSGKQKTESFWIRHFFGMGEGGF